jgi:zinc protease
MRRIREAWLGQRLAGGLLLALLAAPSSGAAQASGLPPLPIDTFSLSNGLLVIVSEDHSVPVVATEMWFEVGSADDPPGQSGLTQLAQLLARAETANLAEGEQARLVAEAGGAAGAFTTHDVTGFWEVVPSHRVELALWLHSERLAGVVLTGNGLDRHRERLTRERRARQQGQPFGGVQMALDSLATDYEPYRHPAMGRPGELEDLSTDRVQAFLDRFFVPGNAVLAVVGDVTGAQVRALTQEYLGSIPSVAPHADRPPAPDTPRSDGERRSTVEDPMAQVPVIYMAYNIPGASHPDVYPLTLLSRILSTGESSRLHRRLVVERQVAPVVFSGLNTRRAAGLFLFGSLPNPGVELDRIERLLDQEIDRLRTEGVTDREVEKARNQVRAAEVGSRLSVKGKADVLLKFHHLYGDAFAVNEELQRFEAVSAEDIVRTARKHLARDNRTVIVGRPAARGAGEGAP